MMSIDVEDWYEPLKYRNLNGWEGNDIDLSEEVGKIISLLKEFNYGATFFIVGEYAEKYPHIVKLIARNGFEIGSHYQTHKPIYTVSQKAFETSMKKNISILEDLSGKKVYGFRSPFFGYTEYIPESLNKLGLVYDSSINPTLFGLHGYRSTKKYPHVLPNGIVEVPMSVMAGFPLSGLAYLKLLPFSIIKRLISPSYILYLHPREIRDDLPLLDLPLKLKYLYYYKTKDILPLIRKMFQEFGFTSIIDYIKQKNLVK